MFKRNTEKGLLLAATLSACMAIVPDAKADPETHDGFYLQLDVGLGYLSTSAEAGGTEINYSGVTIPSSLLLGGTPVKGLVIGGGIITDYAPSPSASINGGTEIELEDVSMYLVGIGPFVDIYPDPNGGLHFQGMLGFGALEASSNGNVGGSDPTGFLLMVGAGHDWWVGDEWSIGVMGRLTFAPLSRESVSFTTIAPGVLATFTYH